MKTHIIVTIILITYSKSIFILKEDHKLQEFNKQQFQRKIKNTGGTGVTYKTILVKPIEHEYICPDQREVCGFDNITYRNRCEVAKGVKVFRIGRCSYNPRRVVKKEVVKVEKKPVFDYYGNYGNSENTRYYEGY